MNRLATITVSSSYASLCMMSIFCQWIFFVRFGGRSNRSIAVTSV